MTDKTAEARSSGSSRDRLMSGWRGHSLRERAVAKEDLEAGETPVVGVVRTVF